jgi:hypothetical protein
LNDSVIAEAQRCLNNDDLYSYGEQVDNQVSKKSTGFIEDAYSALTEALKTGKIFISAPS